MMLMATLGLVPLLSLNAIAMGQLILEQGETINLQVVEVNQDDQLIGIMISGLSGHSALVVRNITEIPEGETIRVHVYLGLAKEGLSGSFQYMVGIDDKVNRLLFGAENSVIWQR